MNETEMGRIALKLLKHQLMRNKMPAPNDFRREIGATAKEVGETTQTLQDFYAAILPALIGKMFAGESVSLTISSKT